MLVMCAENVLRLAEIDCSSPMSANTDLNTGRRADPRGNEQAGLRHQREQSGGLDRDGLAAGVRAGDQQHARRRLEHDVDRRLGIRGSFAAADQQRMPRLAARGGRR